MHKSAFLTVMLTASCWPALANDPQHGVLVGEILRLDAAAKTAVVKLADGTERTAHAVTRTTVRGGQEATAAGKDAVGSLKEGSEVAVHYTAKGTEETANNIAAGAEKSTKVTINYSEGTGRKVVRFFKRKL